jgi:hypothetical protein
MLIALRRCIVPTLVVGVPLLVFALSSLAQASVKDKDAAQSLPDDVNRAKEIAELIAKGQMNLPDATAMAEKHHQGTAVQVRCDVALGASHSGLANEQKERSSANKKGTTGARLVYDVSCFAKDRLEIVRVDGFAKRVMSDGERAEDAPPKP